MFPLQVADESTTPVKIPGIESPTGDSRDLNETNIIDVTPLSKQTLKRKLNENEPDFIESAPANKRLSLQSSTPAVTAGNEELKIFS